MKTKVALLVVLFWALIYFAINPTKVNHSFTERESVEYIEQTRVSESLSQPESSGMNPLTVELTPLVIVIFGNIMAILFVILFVKEFVKDIIRAKKNDYKELKAPLFISCEMANGFWFGNRCFGGKVKEGKKPEDSEEIRLLRIENEKRNRKFSKEFVETLNELWFGDRYLGVLEAKIKDRSIEFVEKHVYSEDSEEIRLLGIENEKRSRKLSKELFGKMWFGDN